MSRTIVLTVLLCAFSAAVGRAQCLDWRTFPHTEPELGGSYALNLEVHDDGSGPALYISGWLTPPLLPHGIVRWDGETFTPFAFPGEFGGPLLSYDDGTGSALYALVSNGRVMKWDGTSWTLLGTALGNLHALAVHDDGTGPALYVAGIFQTIDSVPANDVAKWNGSTWSALGAGPSNPPNQGGAVFALASVDDGAGPALFAAGLFDSIGSNNVAKWQGGAWSGVGGGTNAWVRDAAVWDDGSGPSLYIGGDFFSPTTHIARWDGASWHSVGSGLATNQYPKCMRVLDDGSGSHLWVGFHSNGALQPFVPVQRWDGTTWSQHGSLPFAPQDQCAWNGYVASLAVFDAGAGPRVFAGTTTGALGDVGGVLSKLEGGAWVRPEGPAKGLHGPLRTLQVHDDGTGPALYAAGSQICQADASPVVNVARWNGTGWSPMGTQLFGAVTALASCDFGAGPVLMAADIGGQFGGAHLRTWNGSQWIFHGASTNQPDIYFALQQFGPHLYVGGSFTNAQFGLPSTNLVRWSPSAGFGVVGTPPNAGVNGDVNALVTHDDGSGLALYAGGTFTIAGNISAARIVRFDGTSWTALGSGMNALVGALVSFDDGTGPALYAAGTFTTAGGVTATRVAKWNGASWSALGTGLNAQVLTLEAFDDGSGPALYAGGNFTASGSVPMSHIARWNGTSWSAVGGGIDSTIWSLKSHDDGTGIGAQLFAGGNFHHAGTLPSESIVAWRGCGTTTITKHCFGDGSSGECPCANQGLQGRGCDNALATGGARLNANGTTSPDTIVLHAAGELPNAATLVFQGANPLSQPIPFGDGFRCVGGSIQRLYTTNAVNGAVTVPGTGQPSISARSAMLGVPLTPGTVKSYQAWYRDPNLAFCAPPAGNAWNLSNAVRIVW